ncbi:polysaccharide biosynthesis tyrosine autokinase [Nocardia crassostreae]|uniref:polysaccharide biosynthesis tyrosine autokinase n=1 Tax=Nocardia crassostreae TaxID=53428 RepID=UPI0008320B78|nr:polysaccharide biosynthesis tyrosine autokinase [Nocardia crassostreae]
MNGWIKRVAGLVRPAWLLAVGAGLLGGLFGLAASLAATPQYEAHATLYVSTKAGPEVANASYQEPGASQQLALSLAKLLKTEVVAERVVRSLHLDTSPSGLASNISATVQPETVLIDITVTDSAPESAREIANTLAFEFADYVEELNRTSVAMLPAAQVSLIQPALAPSTPVSPNTTRNIGLGVLGGLLAGIAAANLRDRADRSLRDARTLREVVGAPTLGAIPPARTRRGGPLPLVTGDHRVSEAYKRVRTNVTQALADSPSRLVAVVSAEPAEGKTTTAAGLAVTLAQAGHRVAVVDADLRHPALTEHLALMNEPGLTDFLQRATDGLPVRPLQAMPAVDILPAGHKTLEPSELLASEKAADLWSTLAKHYDYVVIDTPAALPYTDATLIATRADATILVARHGRTNPTSLESAIADLRTADTTLLGSVFTCAPPE